MPGIKLALQEAVRIPEGLLQSPIVVFGVLEKPAFNVIRVLTLHRLLQNQVAQGSELVLKTIFGNQVVKVGGFQHIALGNAFVRIPSQVIMTCHWDAGFLDLELLKF